MLVLSRKLEEEIVIAGEIRVKVIGIRGDRVRLGVTADPNIPIHRGEIALMIAEREAEQAPDDGPDDDPDDGQSLPQPAARKAA